MITLSHSSIQSFRSCPQYFYQTKVLGLRTLKEDDYPRRLGIAFHECVAHRLTTGQWYIPPDEETHQELSELAAKAESIIQSFNLPVEQEGYIEGLLAYDEDWCRVHYEHPVALYRMRLDWMWSVPGTGVSFILDWKTGRKIPNGVGGVDKDQLLGYAQGIYMSNPHLQELHVGVAYVRAGIGGVHWHKVTHEELDRARRRIEVTSVQVNGLPTDDPDAWERTPCLNCAECPALHDCPAVTPEMCNAFEPASRAEVEELYNKMKAMEGVAKKIKGSLERWTNANGEVQLQDGKVLGHHDKRSYKCDRRPDLLTELASHGCHLEEEVSISPTSVKRMLKKAGATEAAKPKAVTALLEEHGHYETTTTFTTK